MSRKLANFMDQPRDIDDPYKMTLSKLRDLFDVLEREGGPAFRGKDITVFIDTNPAFTEYTQVALCECKARLQGHGLPAAALPAEPACLPACLLARGDEGVPATRARHHSVLLPCLLQAR